MLGDRALVGLVGDEEFAKVLAEGGFVEGVFGIGADECCAEDVPAAAAGGRTCLAYVVAWGGFGAAIEYSFGVLRGVIVRLWSCVQCG